MSACRIRIPSPWSPYRWTMIPDSRRGLHCGVSSWRRMPDNSIPCRAKICGSYVNSALAAKEARERKFDEAILLNEAGERRRG